MEWTISQQHSTVERTLSTPKELTETYLFISLQP